MFSEEEEEKRDRDDERQKVRSRLYRRDAGKPEQGGQQEHERHEEDALPARGEERCADGEAEALIELVHVGRKAHQRDRDAEEAEHPGADSHHVRIVAEPAHDRLAEKPDRDRDRHADDGRRRRCGPEDLLDARVTLCAVAVAGDRLEALSDADDDVPHEHIQLVRDRDRRDRRRAERRRLNVEKRARQACHALPEQRRHAHAHDVQIVLRLPPDILRTQPHDAPVAQKDDRHDREARHLAEHRGDRRARDAETEVENEKRIDEQVQDAAADHREHGKQRLPLRAEDAVQHERARQKRRGDQDIARVVRGVRHDLAARADQHHQRFQKEQPERADHDARDPAHQRGGRADRAGPVDLLPAEHGADQTVRAHADAAADRLNDRHQRKHDADRGRRARVDLCDKVRVRGIVDDGDELDEDRRRRFFEEQRSDRLRQHQLPLPFAVRAHGSSVTRDRRDAPPRRRNGTARCRRRSASTDPGAPSRTACRPRA